MLIPLDASLLNNPGSGFYVTTSLLEEQEDNIKLTGVYKEKKPSNVKSFLFVFLFWMII